MDDVLILEDSVADKTDEHGICTILSKVFKIAKDSDIVIKTVSGGITNVLLQCKFQDKTILMRLYGKSTDTIIDRGREFVSHIMLYELDLAPPLYARFTNGFLYGFIEGTPLSHIQLRTWSKQIASQLAILHSEMNLDTFRARIAKFGVNAQQLSSLWHVLHHWISQMEDSKVLSSELNWLIETLEGKSLLVACHSDLLSGNIINTEDNKVAFIDYEYMMIGPRAFDIANHLMEWQGFECEKELIPSADSEEVKNWCRSYLTQLNQCTNENLKNLVAEVKLHYGLPGFFWGVWATLQSNISDLDFDYRLYSESRLTEYWNWKKAFTKK